MWVTILAAVAFAVILWDWLETARGEVKRRYVSKPLSMALIIAVFLTQFDDFSFPVWIFLAGMIFGLGGDIFLMFEGDGWFVAGLSSFLIGHIAYIIGFFFSDSVDSIVWAILLLIPVAVLVSGLMRRIIPNAEKAMKAPVLVYGIVIGLMLYCTLTLILKPEWGLTAIVLAIAGGSLFVLSDSLLALDKFMAPKPAVFVMVTYHLAQIAIAASVVLQFSR